MALSADTGSTDLRQNGERCKFIVIEGAKQPLRESDVYVHRFGDYIPKDPDIDIIIKADKKTNEKKVNIYKRVRLLA